MSPGVIIAWLNITQYSHAVINTLRLRQIGHCFPDDIFKCIFLNENIWISIKISLKFVSKGPINNFPALVEIMAWRCPGTSHSSHYLNQWWLDYRCINPWLSLNELRHNKYYTAKLQKLTHNSISGWNYELSLMSTLGHIDHVIMLHCISINHWI